MPYLYCTTSVTLSSECLNYTEINRNSSLFTGTKMHSGNLLLEHERFITRTIWRRSGEVFLRYWETWKFTLVSNTTPNPQQTTVSCMPLFCLRISKNSDFSHSGKVCSGNHAGDQWIWCCVWPQPRVMIWKWMNETVLDVCAKNFLYTKNDLCQCLKYTASPTSLHMTRFEHRAIRKRTTCVEYGSAKYLIGGLYLTHGVVHMSGMVGLIDVKWKGSASIRYWVNYVTLIDLWTPRWPWS